MAISPFSQPSSRLPVFAGRGSLRRMNYRLQIALASCLVSLFAFGCATNKDTPIKPLTPQEQEAFFSRAQDERRFWLTRYESDRGPVFTGGHRLHTDKFAYAEFVNARRSDLPAITVRLRSQQEYLALLDTSSAASWIEFGVAASEGVIPIGPPPLRLYAGHVGDPIPGFFSALPRLVIDQLHVDTALIYVKAAHGPLQSLTRNQDELRIPIVLGGEFIRAFHYVQFHFPSRQVLFSTTTAYQPDPDRLLATLPMQDYYGMIVVTGNIDGEETPLLLDSVGAFAVASDFGLGDTARQVMIGDLVLRNVAHTAIEETDLGIPNMPRIGRAILDRLVVTFDGRNRRVYFERP